MGVYVYIDGFNFYYRTFKNSLRMNPFPPHYKWLNLLALSQRLAPGQSIDWIGYFTAYVKPNPSDPDQALRQRAYIEALRTLPRMEIVPGKFQSVVKRGVPHDSPGGKPISIDTFEEKGSDVNIAARLVWDAARGVFSEAYVISNDSDLTEAIRIATQEAGRVVHVLSPDISVNAAFRRVATSAAPLDTKLFKRCLFPETLTNAAGVPITRPTRWAPDR